MTSGIQIHRTGHKHSWGGKGPVLSVAQGQGVQRSDDTLDSDSSKNFCRLEAKPPSSSLVQDEGRVVAMVAVATVGGRSGRQPWWHAVEKEGYFCPFVRRSEMLRNPNLGGQGEGWETAT